MTTGTSSLSRRLNLKGLLGPAFVAGVAYIDPGNIATNLTAGSQYGYLLVWVVVAATVSAGFFQFMSAKLGIATGRSLPALLGQRFENPRARQLFWLQAEAVAIATDVAEVLGGAIALSLLSHAPLLVCALVVALVSLVITALRGRGKGQFDLVVIVLMIAATFSFCYIMLRSSVNWGGAIAGIVPGLQGTGSLMLACSVIGATIMPHAIYAHSALSRDTFARGGVAVENNPRRRLFGVRADVTLAMVLAGLGNISVMVFSAANFHRAGTRVTMEGAAGMLDAAVGPGVGLVFVFALLAIGFGSSAVGNYAAEEITKGLLRRNIRPGVRRLMALVPALLIISVAPDVTYAIVISQVVLSFGLPFALFPLVRITADRGLMGQHASPRLVTAIGYVIASLLTGLNLWLVSSLIFGG